MHALFTDDDIAFELLNVVCLFSSTYFCTNSHICALCYIFSDVIEQNRRT